MRIKEFIIEADEWEESGEKWNRFQKWAIDQMMKSTNKVETGNHVSKLENQYFGHPINVGPSNVLQQPFGSVTTNIGANKKWTEFVQSIIDNYENYEAEWKADSAASLLDNPEYKKFLDRAYTDFMGMGENTTEQREQHAMALSGYQVKHFGGKLFGSLFGNIKGARASMTPEVYGALEKAQYDLEQKKITDWDDKRREEQLKFWNMLPYPIKLMVAAGMGKTPSQVEAILSTSGKSDNEIMGAYFNASEPAKPETQKESIVPRQPGNQMPALQKPLMAVSLDRWKQGVLNRYPNAQFRHQKMINGATFAIDNNKQVGIYDPKNNYAKVGPESLKTEAANPAQQAAIAIAKKKEQGINEFSLNNNDDNGDEKSYLLQLAKDLSNALYVLKNKQAVKAVKDKIIASGGDVKVLWNDDGSFNVVMYHPTYFKQGYLVSLVGKGKQQGVEEAKDPWKEYEFIHDGQKIGHIYSKTGQAPFTTRRKVGRFIKQMNHNSLKDAQTYLINQALGRRMYQDMSIDEDWQKVNKKDKTDGMSKKAVSAYRRENPGSKLKTAVTTKPSKLKKGSKDANRRKSFCARMSGMKKAHASAKTKRDPDSPINKALRRWNCESVEQMQELVMIAEQKIRALKK